MSVAPYAGPPARDVVDGWVGQLLAVEQLAGAIAATEFVPAALRGKPAAVAACVLAGRELGIGPMTSLAHLHVIEGRPSMSAQLMRAMVQAAGHELAIEQLTSSTCTLAGRRAGATDYARVTWTMQDARVAEIDRKTNWRRYPRAMLLARATGELCRAMFADVLAGMAMTAEEAADLAGVELERPADPAGTGPRMRTVSRRDPTRALKSAPPVAADDAPAPATGPELPGDEPAEPELAAEPEPAEEAPPAEAEEPPDPHGPATDAQAKRIHMLLRQLEPGMARDRRLRIARALLGRDVGSFGELTLSDASAMIQTLIYTRDAEDPAAHLEWLIEVGEADIEAREAIEAELELEAQDELADVGPADWGEEDEAPPDP